MKSVKYLFFSCFNNGGRLNNLKQEKLALEVEEERLLTPNLYENTTSMFPVADCLYFSKYTGKEISVWERIKELRQDIETLETQIKKEKCAMK